MFVRLYFVICKYKRTNKRPIIMLNETSSVFIRKARRKDRFEMKACNERNLQENYDLDFWEKPLASYPWKSFVLCDKNNHIRGYLFADETTIISFAIDKEYRNNGWGSKLLKIFLETAGNNISGQPQSCKYVQLHVRCSNQVACDLYKKFNFQIAGTIPGYYRNPIEDGFLMNYKT